MPTIQSERLLPKLDLMSSVDLSDIYYALASNVEDAFETAGMVPGQDYTSIDLFKLSQPLLVELLKIRKDIAFDFPAVEVVS